MKLSWLLLFVGFICLVAWQIFILQRHDFRHEIPAAGALLNSLNTLEAQAAQAVHPTGSLHLLPALPPAPQLTQVFTYVVDTPDKVCAQALNQSKATGNDDCESKCTAHPKCKYYSLWTSGWCRLSAECDRQNWKGVTIYVKQASTWEKEFLAARKALAEKKKDNHRISEENEALKAQLQSQAEKLQAMSCCNDGETLSNVSKHGNQFRKTIDSGGYDAYVLWRGSSICAKAGQTDKHLRIGLAPSRTGDHEYQGGAYAGLFPSGQLYPSGSSSAYSTSDIICLRAAGADIVMYKNGEKHHTWINAASDCMIVKLWMQEYNTSAIVVQGTELSPTYDCKDTSTALLALQSMTAPLPYYDIVALIFSTASPHDAKRMELAESTWLNWHGKYRTNMTMTHIFALCQGDPGTTCKGKDCTIRRPRVVVLPCKHSYNALVGKSSAGYRYIAEHFNFSYVLKADVDSIMDVPCAVEHIRNIPAEACRSWGLGLWRQARDSQVFTDERTHGKYANPEYKKDTGNDWYPPYLTGWAFIWSGDVARFLGMGGLPQEKMPVWRDTWTIEDAAIGTFVAGLNICRVSLAGHCPIWTDVEDKDFKMRNMILGQADEDTLANEIEVDAEGKIRDVEGPHKDNDIPGLGDLANVQAKSLKHCAAKCFLHKECRAWEYSATVTPERRMGTGLNCQLVSVKFPRVGRRFHDYHLYIRLDV